MSLISCDGSGCKPVRLTIRNYTDISEEYREKYFPNGGIEIASQDEISSFMANNADGGNFYCDLKNKWATVAYEGKGLLVVIKW